MKTANISLLAGILGFVNAAAPAQSTMIQEAPLTRITAGLPATDVGCSPVPTACGDFDGDGYPDVFVTRYLSGLSTFYHNNRDGTFTANSSFPSQPTADKCSLQFAQAIYNVAEDAGSAALMVLRLNDVHRVVSVEYTCEDGTATNGFKYTAVAGTLTFGDGETNKLIAVPILNEPYVEGTRSFQVILRNPAGGAILGSPTAATVLIKDNDTGMAFEFSSYSVAEDAGSVVVGAVRGDDGDFPISVDYATSNVTAIAGQDYVPASGTLNFAPGEQVKLISITILNDGLKEPNKTFRLSLNNPTGGGTLGARKTTTVTVLDNDPGVQFEFDRCWVEETSESLSVRVLRGSDVSLPSFAVDYTTAGQTAVAGEDYVDSKGTLVFGSGDTSKFLTISILRNANSALDKQYQITLRAASDDVVMGANSRATVTVLDTTGMAPHGFAGATPTADGTLRFSLAGGVSKRFKPFFDLYPVQTSTDLVHWSPLLWLVRTNAAPDALVFGDSTVRQSRYRFYGVPTDTLIVPNQPPTGPFAVGRDDRMVTDPTRRNRYQISTNGSFMVSIWYPAERVADQLPALWEDEAIARDPRWYGAWVDRVPRFRSYSARKAPFATSLFRRPVVLFSHGLQGYRNDVIDKAENLASHGYVVLALDHFDCSATVFPDGRYIFGTDHREMTAANVPDRVRDFNFVMAEMERWNQRDSLFPGRLDLEKVAVIGYSWGSESAAEFCRTETRCRAAVNLDGGFTMAHQVMLKPTLSINRAGNADTGLFTATTAESFWFQLSSTDHSIFGASYFAPDARAQEAIRTINAFTLWFLNRGLKGSADPMPRAAEYPRIVGFRQK